MGGWLNAIMALAAFPAARGVLEVLPTVKRLRRLNIAGRDPEEAVESAQEAARAGCSFSLTFLGEPPDSGDAVGRNLAVISEAIDRLARNGIAVSISIDVKDLGGGLSQTAALRNVIGLADRFVRAVGSREAEMLKRASEGVKAAPSGGGRGGDLLMVGASTLGDQRMAMTACEEFTHHGVRAGCTIHAALERSEKDAKELISMRCPVRLVEGGPAPPGVSGHTEPEAVRENFLKLARLLVSEEAGINGAYPVFALQGAGVAKAVLEIVAKAGWKYPYALELPFGGSERLHETLMSRGFPVRLLMPFGERWWLQPDKFAT